MFHKNTTLCPREEVIIINTQLPSLTPSSIIVGMDVHKYAHTAVALDCFGQEVTTLTFRNDTLDECVAWLQKLGSPKQLIIGLEDIHGNGVHLRKRLSQEGFCLVYVPAVLTDRARSHSVHKEKSDYHDAMRVGKVILHQREETLPAELIIPPNYELVRSLDVLLQERETLTREQTRLKNQLHGLLHQHYGNGYKQEFRDIFSQQAREFFENKLAQEREQTNSCALLSGSILRHLGRLAMIQKQRKEIDSELHNQRKQLPEIELLATKIVGCGELTASKIMVEIGTIKRFETESKLAKYCGIAPIPHQSGGSTRVYTNSSGNRKLNRAVHTIALSQIGNRGSSEGTHYYQKKLSEGKSKLWAMRCLKRQIVRRIFTTLS